MNKFIALINDNGLISINDIVTELEDKGCVLTGVHKTIGVISGDSSLSIQELKDLRIPGIKEISEDKEKQLIAPPDSDIQ